MKIAIVGAEGAKFTSLGEVSAMHLIDSIISEAVQVHELVVIVSGHCHLGGIDIWAENLTEVFAQAGNRVGSAIFPPAVLKWNGSKDQPGFRQRNESIAETCDVLHNIVVDALPPGWRGLAFEQCYHCRKRGKPSDHVKSGGCWTMWEAYELGKPIHLHVVKNYA